MSPFLPPVSGQAWTGGWRVSVPEAGKLVPKVEKYGV